MAKNEEMKTPVAVVKPTGRERARSRWLTVEPVIAFGMMGYTCISLVRPLFVKDTVRQFHNYNETNKTECRAATHTGADALDDKIQSEASLWLLYLAAASGLPAILSTIVFCTASDRLGRKMAMAIPILGFAVQAAVYCVTVQLKLPLPVLFAGEFIQGLTGGFGLLFAACISYITDASSQKQRTMRIVIAEMLTFLVGGLNQVGQGYLIQISYLPSLAIAVGVNVAALLYITLPPFLIETIDGSTSDHREFLEVWRSMKRLLAFNENGRRWQMLLLDFFIFFCVSQFMGISAIYVLYGTAQPFCWMSTTAGIGLALGWVASSIGMLVGTKLFSFCFGDYWLMQISCLSIASSYLVMGFAKSTLVMFIGTAMGCFRGISIPVARSVLSKITHPDEIGAMFSIVGCLESCTFASGLLATSVYAASVSFLPPLTFYVYAGATLIPIGITLILQMFWPQRNQYIPLNIAINTEPISDEYSKGSSCSDGD